MKQRTIEKITTAPIHPGFLGEGHWASAVIDGRSFEETDPFLLLMDDRLNLPGGKPVGGPHPHAGFETATLVLQGNDREWKTGSFELMTAGKGIVHTEEITTKTDMRILQLWLVLPPDQRWAEPAWQEIQLEDVPTLKTAHSEIRVYSGSSQGLISPLRNYTPFTLVDFHQEAGAEIFQTLPNSYHGFIYVVNGRVSVSGKEIAQGEAGWFNTLDDLGESEITFKTDGEPSRFVLYAGEPQRAAVVSHGPFIGDSEADIRRLYSEYRQGRIPHLNDLPANRKTSHHLMPAK